MKYDELIVYKEDLAKAYADRRSNMNEHEALELIRCLTGFLQSLKQEQTIELPRIGSLYKKQKPFSEDSERKFSSKILPYDEDIVRLAYKRVREIDFLYEPTKVEKYYDGFSKIDLQEYQNNRSLEN